MTAQIIAGGIHLVNSNGAQTAGGTATAADTTPFAIRNRWPLGVAETKPIMSGGPPFSLGSHLLYRGYDNVIETIPINVLGTSHVNAVAKLQELKLALNTGNFSAPALLSIKPDASSSGIYVEILAADVREVTDDSGSFDAWEGTTEIDAEITWIRAPLFSAGTLTTLQNGLTWNNTGTGANNNTQSLGAITGDLLYEGSPLNIKIAPASGDSLQYAFLATVYQRVYDATVAATTTTSSTTGAVAYNTAPSNAIDPARLRSGLRLRVILRCTSISAKAQVQVSLIGWVGANRTLWRGPWVSGNATGVTLVDATPQGVPLDIIRRATLGGGRTDVGLLVRSTDGTSVSLNLHSVEYLLYYTFCRIDATGSVSGTGGEWLQTEAAQNLNGTAYVPSAYPSAFAMDTDTGTDYLVDIGDVRGTLPRAISGGSLYISWMRSAYVFDGTDTALVTTKHLPLFRSLRGAG